MNTNDYIGVIKVTKVTVLRICVPESNKWVRHACQGCVLAGVAAAGRPRTIRYPVPEIRASTPALTRNNCLMPSLCASKPESRSPRTCANEIKDIKLLLTLPTMAAGDFLLHL